MIKTMDFSTVETYILVNAIIGVNGRYNIGLVMHRHLNAALLHLILSLSHNRQSFYKL